MAAANPNRLAGTLYVSIDGVQQKAKGAFTYNLGQPKREPVMGAANKVLGYKETGQTPKIEGVIVNDAELDVKALTSITDATVTLELANDKTVVQRNSWYSAEGDVNTEEGDVQILFHGLSSEEV